MVLEYADLPGWEQDLIDEVQLFMGDLDPDETSRYFTDDQYATILKAVVHDFNRTRPKTNYGAADFPQSHEGVLYLGLLYHASMARYGAVFEYLEIKNYAGPNIDLSHLRDLWGQRWKELQPEWFRVRNAAKLEFLPTGVGTVDMNGNWVGRSASIVPILRAMPSWNYAR